MMSQLLLLLILRLKFLTVCFVRICKGFFGKNGTNDLGFMRIIKGSDSSELEATFYHFVSNDKFKDTQFVLSAKYELYTKHMPAHIDNVQYRSDGAANLACTLHYLVQPM